MQTFTSEFVSHWVFHSYGLVPNFGKKFSELLNYKWRLQPVVSHFKDYVSYKKITKETSPSTLKEKRKTKQNNHAVRVITHGLL